MTGIGLQAMMLAKEFEARGVVATLREALSIGYRIIEVSRIPMTAANLRELRRAKDELGLEVVATSAEVTAVRGSPNDAMDADFDKIVTDARALGVGTIRIPSIPLPALRDSETLRAFCAEAQTYAARFADLGLRLAYHTHHLEFARFDAGIGVEMILELAPALTLEVDVHWVHRGGYDAPSAIRRWADRVALVHLKDYRIARIPESFDGPGFPSDVVEFAEVGEGTLDFPAIVAASLDVGVEHMLVEQDDTYGRPVLDSLRISHDNLVALGYADLF